MGYSFRIQDRTVSEAHHAFHPVREIHFRRSDQLREFRQGLKVQRWIEAFAMDSSADLGANERLPKYAKSRGE